MIGDIHGDKNWKKAINNQLDSNYFIFVGDYFDSFTISTKEQCDNFMDIIKFKEKYPNKIILLIGNHDHHYIQKTNFGTAGYQKIGKYTIEPLWDKYIAYFTVCFKFDKYLFSHAGISIDWLNNHFNNIGYDYNNIDKDINDLYYYIPNSFNFSTKAMDFYGEDIFQGPLWIRPKSLMMINENSELESKFIQIFGHTSICNPYMYNFKYINVDILNSKQQYLVIDNDKLYYEKI